MANSAPQNIIESLIGQKVSKKDADALFKANITTPEALATIDIDKMADESHIKKEKLKKWKTIAQNKLNAPEATTVEQASQAESTEEAGQGATEAEINSSIKDPIQNEVLPLGVSDAQMESGTFTSNDNDVNSSLQQDDALPPIDSTLPPGGQTNFQGGQNAGSLGEKIFLKNPKNGHISVYNPRFKRENIEQWQIFADIKEHGVLQPVIAVHAGEDEFEVIDGGTRLICAQLLGLPTIPCIIRDLSEEEKCRQAFALNDTQRPFSQMERARMAFNIKKEHPEKSNEAVGGFLGIEKSQASLLIAINKNPEEIQVALHLNEISLKDANELSRLPFDVKFDSTLKGFDWSQEPEEWKEIRLKQQMELFSLVRSGMMVHSTLRQAITKIIEQEEKRRQQKIVAEKEAKERAAKEKDEQLQGKIRLESLIESEQKSLDKSIDEYVALSKLMRESFNVEFPEDVSKVLIIKPEDYAPILKFGSVEFYSFYKLCKEDAAGQKAAIRSLNAHDDSKFFTFKNEKYCLCCGSLITTNEQKKILIADLEAEVAKIEQQKKLINDFKSEFLAKAEEIKAHHGALTRHRADLAKLEQQLNNVCPPGGQDFSNLSQEELKEKLLEVNEKIKTYQGKINEVEEEKEFTEDSFEEPQDDEELPEEEVDLEDEDLSDDDDPDVEAELDLA